MFALLVSLTTLVFMTPQAFASGQIGNCIVRELSAAQRLEQAMKSLDAHGVAYKRLSESPASGLAIEILPGDQSLWNRFARGVKEKYGLKLRYNPEVLEERQASGLFQPLKPSDDPEGDLGILFASESSILNGSPKDPAVIHELTHAKNRVRLFIRKKASPFYGRATALSGRLPGKLRSYDQSIAMDEVEAFKNERPLSKSSATLLVGVWERQKALVEIAEKAVASKSFSFGKGGAFEYFGKVYSIGTDVVDLHGVVHGEISIRCVAGRGRVQPFKLRLPILGSSGVADPRNTELFSAQLELLSKGLREVSPAIDRARSVSSQ